MKNKMIANAISAVLALGISGANAAETNQDQQMQAMMSGNVNGMERCYGIAKSGLNDCSTSSHGCAGEAKQNSSGHDWLFVPTGLCNKIVGGSLEETKK